MEHLRYEYIFNSLKTNSKTEIAPKLSKSSKIVVHCRSGKRSAIVTGILTGHGYDAVNYDGGYTKWKDNFTACTLPS